MRQKKLKFRICLLCISLPTRDRTCSEALRTNYRVAFNTANYANESVSARINSARKWGNQTACGNTYIPTNEHLSMESQLYMHTTNRKRLQLTNAVLKGHWQQLKYA